MAEMPPAPSPPDPAPPAQRKIVLPPHRVRAARPRSQRIRDWAHYNLFHSRGATALTLIGLAFAGLILAGVIWFVFFEADWGVVTANRWLLFAGSFPHEKAWRLWVSLVFTLLLIGSAYGVWASFGRRDLLFIALAGAFVIFLMAHGGASAESSLWFLVGIVCLFAGYLVGQLVPRGNDEQTPIGAMVFRNGFANPRRVRMLATRSLGAVMALSLPIILIILLAFGGARTRELDGFVLNLLLAPVGIVGGIILAIPLAVGRASSLRLVSWLCTAFIEMVRGAPLIGWLFVALFILDDVIGGELLLRTMITLAVFTSCYMAEYIRGGLQALPRGQYEAAQAVGLPRWRAMQLIILPQALRISIPPLVGQAIALWKDTALISVILPLRELVGNGRSAIGQVEFIDSRIEAFIFIAVAFWVIAFMMSRISQRVERTLGVGER